MLGWVPPEYVSGCQPSSVVYNPASGQPSENAQYRQPPMSPDYFNRMKNSPTGSPVQIQQQPLPEAQQAASQTQSSQQVGTGTISKAKHILKDVREVLLCLESCIIKENACDQRVDVVDF